MRMLILVLCVAAGTVAGTLHLPPRQSGSALETADQFLAVGDFTHWRWAYQTAIPDGVELGGCLFVQGTHAQG